MTAKTTDPNEQKTRCLRMDDTRWKFFKDNLGSAWLRKKIDSEIKKENKPAIHETLDQ